MERQGLVFDIMIRRKFQKHVGCLLICSASFLSISCGYSPSKGRIVVVKREKSPDIVYVTNIPRDVSSMKSNTRLLVLPTGSEERKDAVRDLDTIWADTASKHNFGVVCPASSQGFPFEIPRNGFFGAGGEHVISHVISDARHRNLLPTDNQAVFLIHLWGGGTAVLRIVELNNDVFDEVYLAPSATVDIESIDEYEKMKSAPKLWIILGNHGHKVVEEWYYKNKRDNVEILLAPFSAPYQTLETEKSMKEIASDYANFITDMISQKST